MDFDQPRLIIQLAKDRGAAENNDRFESMNVRLSSAE
jgi:hypothetical protein